MKKTTFKTMASTLLIAITLSLLLLNGCKKNVSDVYDYKPVVLAPDFELLNVQYTVSNDELNSESELSFKVEFKNNEVTENTYTSVLNFYVDGEIQQSVPLEDLAAGTGYEKFFEWQAVAGNHAFKFEINLSSDGSEFVAEENTANNSKTTNLDIAAKKLTVVQEVTVTPAVATEAINADTQSNVAAEMAKAGLTIASTVEPVKTTYDDHTTAIVAAVAKSDGTIDPTKVVLSITSNSGVTQGQKQEAKTSMIVETLVDKKEVSFYNQNEKLTYQDGVVTFSQLKSASVAATCTEPGNLELLGQFQAAVTALQNRIKELIAQYGVEEGLRKAPAALIEVMNAYGFTQGNVDNPPTFTFEILQNSNKKEECVDMKKVEVFGQPGFRLRFKDDRGGGATPEGANDPIAVFEKLPGEQSNNGTYKFKDCGGNPVSYTFTGVRIVIQTNDNCIPDVHNVNN